LNCGSGGGAAVAVAAPAAGGAGAAAAAPAAEEKKVNGLEYIVYSVMLTNDYLRFVLLKPNNVENAVRLVMWFWCVMIDTV